MKMQGLFASDIDNTLTDKRLTIPEKVAEALAKWHSLGWEMIFLTGRSFTFAYYSVGSLPFPYYLGVHNGAELLEMPERKILAQNFLSKEVLWDLDEIYRDHKEDFLIFAGYERGDFCYYRPKRFSEKFQSYFEKVKPLQAKEPWVEIEDFSKVQASFPEIKCLGEKGEMIAVREKLLKKRDLNVILMQDAVYRELWILLITHKEAGKGKILRKLARAMGWKGFPIIAAGDSYNDICLLKEGDIAIAMEDGPNELKELATIIAKPAEECGIIEALELAVKHCRGRCP